MSWFSDVLRSPSHVSISSRFTLFPYTTLFRSPRAKVLQLGTVFRLDAEMVEAVLHCPGGNREVDARIIELPLCVVVDRKSTRLNSSHTVISYAVFCLKKKKS